MPQVSVNVTRFADGDGYVFKVVASVGDESITASRVFRVDNTGPVVAVTASPTFGGAFVLSNVEDSVVTATYVSGPAIATVSFYRELSQVRRYR